mgnify:CR=1 FL=1
MTVSASASTLPDKARMYGRRFKTQIDDDDDDDADDHDGGGGGGGDDDDVLGVGNFSLFLGVPSLPCPLLFLCKGKWSRGIWLRLRLTQV